MDDLQDAIQDAAYIGALCDTGFRPTSPLVLPLVSEAEAWARRAESENSLLFSFDTELAEPLGWFLFRKYLCGVGECAELALDFVADVQSYQSISTPSLRLSKAAEIISTYFKRKPRNSRTAADASTMQASSHRTELLLEYDGSKSTSSKTSQRRFGGVMPHPDIPRASATDTSVIDRGSCEDVGRYVDKGEDKPGPVTPPPSGYFTGSVVTTATDALQRPTIPAPKQNVLFRPGMGLHAVIRARKDVHARSSFEEAFKRYASDSTVLGVEGTLLDEVRAVVEDHALAKLTDGGTMIYEAREKEIAFVAGAEEVGLAKDLFDRLRNIVFEGLHQKYWHMFVKSEHQIEYLRYKAMESKPVTASDFTLFRVLGRGGFGVVNGCKKSNTGHLYAMKAMNKRRIKQKNAADLCWNERIVLGKVDSPFVISLKYAFSTEEDLFLILDLATGGDLAYHLAKAVRFSEARAKFYAAQILLGLEHLHALGIVYRDLKPENILLDDAGNAKISDLGLATHVTPTLCGRCGTRGYWAPEMLVRIDGRRQTYGCAVDWWSFGCLLYEFLAGKCPFRTEAARSLDPDKHKSMDKATLHMEVPYDDRYFSSSARSLLKALLTRDPARRLGAKGPEEIKSHPFFADVDWGLLQAGLLPAPWVPETSINAAAQDMIGAFDDASRKVALEEDDQARYRGWEITNKQAFQQEMVDFLNHQERMDSMGDRPGVSCCVIM